MTFRAYDVVVGYSEVCFSVIANSEKEALTKADEMTGIWHPAREPFVCYMYVDSPCDPHLFEPVMRDVKTYSYIGRDYYNRREVCQNCAHPLSHELHEPTFKAQLQDFAPLRHSKVALSSSVLESS
jgi:hypothetical protein